ncbi:MAG: tRNA pseudouridine(38-40) synthase TruA [Nitrospirota bacterium]|nr:tRNA pseudouridine(38-40) synthase TruA [Nitrospirota bacterium]
MRRIRLTLQYDGTNYSGWQVQPDRVTIQGVIETRLRKMTGEETMVLSAGRTDAGVHALQQVASFDTASQHPPGVFQKALNGMLPPDIRIISSEYAGDDFHPRYSAKAKSYFYLIDCSETGNPFTGRYSYYCKYRLDSEKMIKAAACLTGRHDFSSFRASGCGARSPVREIYDIKVEQMNTIEFLTVGFSGLFIRISVKGNAFLRHMVRNIAGTMIEVGRNRISPEGLKAILEARNRRLAGPAAPARGLFLERVFY